MKYQGVIVEYKKEKVLNEGWRRWKVWEIEFETYNEWNKDGKSQGDHL